ncbi:serine hydrolase [Dokdonella sp.]|uniref:serine hydrolase n=1 Tax=Dokdonella sp. TaxID=2291710 RepID=UPI0035281E71
MPTQFRALPVFCIASALVWSAFVSAAPPADLDARINTVIREQGVPGMAVAIVEEGKTVVARGYGVLKLGSGEPVDADTIFPIGSVSKAFTSAALAVLVDDGKIDWDDPVVNHLPGFQMYDPWVTREISIRDLLVHRSGLGLGAGDLLFVPRTSRSREDAVHRLRYIKPATSFRSGYAYDNLLYIVAGQLIESVSGQTWEAFVRDRLLKPAGMNDSTTESVVRFARENRAQPHARLDGKMRGIGNQEVLDEKTSVISDAAAPAGGVLSSANDMGRWLAIQLGHGALPGSGADQPRLFSEEAGREMWTPQVLIPIRQFPEPIADATPQFSAYALGWDVEDYRGTKIITHGGAVFGAQTLVVLVPQKDVGFYLQINSEDGVVLRGMMNELLDHYLGAPSRDWVSDFATYKKERVAAALEALDALASEPVAAKRSRPSLALSGYAGTFADPWYGPVEITQQKGKLRINFTLSPGMIGTLEHFQYDTFRTVWDDRTIENAYVTFALDAEGKVSQITLKAVSPLADFSYDYQDLLLKPVPGP